MRRFITAALALVALAMPLRAASIYDFDTFLYVIPTGTTISIPVYLKVTDSDATTLLDDQGLFSAGVRMQMDAINSSVISPPNIAVAGDVNPNSVDFTDPSPFIDYVGSGNAGLLEYADVMSPTGPTGTGTLTMRRVLLGNFIITAGNTPGEFSTFHALDFDTGTDDTITEAGSVLDPIGPSLAVRIEVVAQTNAVPLPGIAWGGIMLLGGLGITRFIRRRKLI